MCRVLENNIKLLQIDKNEKFNILYKNTVENLILYIIF